MNYKYRVVAIVLALFGGFSIASAHVVVKPDQVGVGAFQTFTMSVPSEKDLATVDLRLVLPEGLDYVTPSVKPGWSVVTKSSSENGNTKATEISWSKGTIPPHMRDDFTFSAKVPSTPGNLQWRAYQTYQNGEVVSWDIDASTQPKDASGKPDFSKSGPYSETKVIDDLKEAPPPSSNSNASTALVLSIVALVFSLAAIAKRK